MGGLRADIWGYKIHTRFQFFLQLNFTSVGSKPFKTHFRNCISYFTRKALSVSTSKVLFFIFMILLFVNDLPDALETLCR